MNDQRYVSDKEEAQAIMARMTAHAEQEPVMDGPGLKATFRLLRRLIFLSVKVSLGVDRNGHSLFHDLAPGVAVARYLLRLATFLLVIAAILMIASIPLLFINAPAAGAFLLVDVGIMGIVFLVFILCFFAVWVGAGRSVRRGRLLMELGWAFGRFVEVAP